MRCESCGQEMISKATPTLCNECFTKLNPERQTEAMGVPIESEAVPGFNWGACFLTPLWLMFHGHGGLALGLIVLSFVSRLAGLAGVTGVFLVFLLQLIVMGYFGTRGNSIALEKRGYTSLEELKLRERPWNIAGIVVGLVVIIPINVLALMHLFG